MIPSLRNAEAERRETDSALTSARLVNRVFKTRHAARETSCRFRGYYLRRAGNRAITLQNHYFVCKLLTLKDLNEFFSQRQGTFEHCRVELTRLGGQFREKRTKWSSYLIISNREGLRLDTISRDRTSIGTISPLFARLCGGPKAAAKIWQLRPGRALRSRSGNACSLRRLRD